MSPPRPQPNYNHHVRRSRNTISLFSLFSLLSISLTLCGGALESASAESPFLVPDRPGYSDSVMTVRPKRWHLELGSALTPSVELSATTLIRYGVAQGWELRLAGPTLTQVFASSLESALTPNPARPPLAVGGASLGAKWAYAHRDLKGSMVLMVGLPTSGADVAISPDPVLLFTAQVEHPLNRYLSVNLALRAALLDEMAPTIESVYGSELGGLFGAVGAVSWSEVDWSLYVQGGAELIQERLTPLTGLGATLRLAYNAQVDLSLNAPLTPDGVTPRYELGLTFGW